MNRWLIRYVTLLFAPLQKSRQNFPFLCVNRIRYDFCAGAKALRYGANKAQYSISDFFLLILGSGSSLIDQNLLLTDHTLASTWLLNYISNDRINDSVGQYNTGSDMIGTLNVGRDEAEGRRAMEVKLNLASFISILNNLLWPVTNWIKEAFLLLSRGWFFFFCEAVAFTFPHLPFEIFIFLSSKKSRKFQRAWNATALLVCWK